MAMDRGRREFVEMALLSAAASPFGGGQAFAQNGVAAWQKLRTEPYPGKQDDLYFIDREVGWYGNGAGKLFGTVDGGENWTKIWEKPGTFIRSLGFLDARRGFLGNVGVNYYPEVADPVPLYRTDDGGRHWLPVQASGLDRVAGICGIDILPVKRIFQGDVRVEHVVHAAGRVGGPAVVLRSEDDGLTWRVIDLSRQAGMILDVKFINARIGFVAASGVSEDGSGEALILRTIDGGEAWQTVYRSGRRSENVWKMSWPTAKVGYGTVQSYDESSGNVLRIFVKTVDGGNSWTEHQLTIGPGIQEFGVGFASEARGWIGCKAGGYETRDGGRSWTPANIGRAVNKIRIVRDGNRTRLFSIGVDLRRLDLP